MFKAINSQIYRQKIKNCEAAQCTVFVERGGGLLKKNPCSCYELISLDHFASSPNRGLLCGTSRYYFMY